MPSWKAEPGTRAHASSEMCKHLHTSFQKTEPREQLRVVKENSETRDTESSTTLQGWRDHHLFSEIKNIRNTHFAKHHETKTISKHS